MSSSLKAGDTTVRQTEVVVTSTPVSSNASDVEDVIIDDINKIGKGALKSLDGFRAFILRGNVIDLAIGIVIGAAFTAVVNSLVGDIITPLIPVSKTSNLSTWSLAIPHTYINLHIGAFLNAIISFLIVAAVLYFFVVQPVNSFMKLYHNKEATAAPATRECPYCCQAVSVKATRCPFCTSPLPSGGEQSETEEQGPVLVLPASLEALSDKLAERIVKKATSAMEQGTAGADETLAEQA